MTASTTETITIAGAEITLPLLIWRRFRRPMPGLVEATLVANPGLADLGPVIPVGTVITLSVPVTPDPVAALDPITLW
jgi:phage tail protein X